MALTTLISSRQRDIPDRHIRVTEFMPPKSNSVEVEFKLRINKSLMDRVNTFRHDNQLDSKKAAIVVLIERALTISNDFSPLNTNDAPSKTDSDILVDKTVGQ